MDGPVDATSSVVVGGCGGAREGRDEMDHLSDSFRRVVY